VQRCRDCGKAKRPHIYCDRCSTNIFDVGKDVQEVVPPLGSTTP
jgi:large subunit ribosomal protein L32